MTEARPRPLVGALLGLALGLVLSALLWALGVLAPDRLPLFGILALCVAGVGALTTQRMAASRAGAVVMIVIASMLGGVALTGIPETVAGGSLSEGCTLEAMSSVETEPVSPASTSIISPFDVTTTDTVEWAGSIPVEVDQADVSVALLVGGFEIPLDDTVLDNPGGARDWSGSIDVGQALNEFQDRYVIPLTGVFHVSAQASAEGGACEGDGYARIQAPGAFSGLLLAVLWALLAIVVVGIIVVAIVVRRGFSAVDAQARTTAREVPPEQSLRTGEAVEPDAGRAAAPAAAGGAAVAAERARRDDALPPEPQASPSDAPQEGAAAASQQSSADAVRATRQGAEAPGSQQGESAAPTRSQDPSDGGSPTERSPYAPVPGEPEPAPEPWAPEPVEPDPADAEVSDPEAAEPETAEPEMADTEPGDPGPLYPEPVYSEPGDGEPAGVEPVGAESVDAEPLDADRTAATGAEGDTVDVADQADQPDAEDPREGSR